MLVPNGTWDSGISGAAWRHHAAGNEPMTETTMTDVPTTTAEPVERRLAARVDAGRTQIRQSAVAMIRGDHVTVGQAAVGAVLSGGDVTLSQAGTRAAIAGGSMRIRQGGGGMFLAGGDAEISQGGVGTLVALGDVRIAQGGTGMTLTRRLDAGDGSWVGIALTPRLEAAPGARILMGPAQAGIVGGVAGVLVAVIVLVSRAIRGR